MVSTSKPKSELIKLKSLNKRKLTSKDKEQQQEGTTTRRRRWEHDASVIKKKTKKLNPKHHIRDPKIPTDLWFELTFVNQHTRAYFVSARERNKYKIVSYGKIEKYNEDNEKKRKQKQKLTRITTLISK